MNALENNKNTITLDTAIGILESRLPISAEGKYRVKVSQINDFYRKNAYSTTVAIANFNAMTPYQAEQANIALDEGRYNDALNHNLNLAILEGQYRPTKNEIVDIMVQYVTLKDKSTGLPTGEQALLVTSLSPIQAVAPKGKFSFRRTETPTGSGSVVPPEMEVEPTTKTVKA